MVFNDDGGHDSRSRGGGDGGVGWGFVAVIGGVLAGRGISLKAQWH